MVRQAWWAWVVTEKVLHGVSKVVNPDGDGTAELGSVSRYWSERRQIPQPVPEKSVTAPYANRDGGG